MTDTAAETTAAAPVTDPGAKGAWWPGLDGPRGFAICGTLLYHHDATRVPGGYFSVSLFFTLSGFLITTPAFDQLYKAATTDALRRWSALGVPILFTDTLVPAWKPTLPTGNPNVPGTGPIKMNDAGRARHLNALTAEVLKGIPLAEMVPYDTRIAPPA